MAYPIGYVEFIGNRRTAGCAKLLPRAHWIAATGTADNNRHYCTKPILGCFCAHCGPQPVRLAGPWEHGTPGTDSEGRPSLYIIPCTNRQGNSKRTDLIKLRDAIRSGKRRRDLLEDEALAYTVSKYPRFMELCYDLYPTQREGDDGPEVTLLYGPPGCGKTRGVSDESQDLWKAPLGKGGWYNRYDGHPDVLLDDFSGKASHTALADLLKLLDRYPETVPTKGGFVGWRPRRIFLTTNIHPWDWYDWTGREVHYPALKRRFTRVIAWRSNGTDRLELTAAHPLWERFWEHYSLSGLSAPNERTWDDATRAWRLISKPGDWKDKFDYLYR